MLALHSSHDLSCSWIGVSAMRNSVIWTAKLLLSRNLPYTEYDSPPPYYFRTSRQKFTAGSVLFPSPQPSFLRDLNTPIWQMLHLRRSRFLQSLNLSRKRKRKTLQTNRNRHGSFHLTKKILCSIPNLRPTKTQSK